MTKPNITGLTGLKITSSSKNAPLDALFLSVRTNAQMNAIAAVPGTVIYNSDTGAFMGYVGGNNPGWKTFTVA